MFRIIENLRILLKRERTALFIFADNITIPLNILGKTPKNSLAISSDS